MQSLINLLTVDQLTAAKEGRIVWLTNASQRNSVVKLGFAVVQEDRRNSRLHPDCNVDLSRYLNAHGVAVHVVSIDDKYNDSMGAFEVVHCMDYLGREFSVSNLYDTSTCFRLMSHSDLLDYVNART
jgi:hypothetical protein